MRKALCIGINYIEDTEGRLRGCANDAANMAALFQQAGYDCTIVVDEDPTVPVPEGAVLRNGVEYTCKSALLAELRALRDATLQGDVHQVAITYSGHGTQTRDFTRDELDGLDEAWVPSDYARAGLIVDDQLGQLLRTFHAETKVFMVSDACHSGTIIDLPFQYDVRMLPSPSRRTSMHCRNRIVHISGCRDFQTSADAQGVEGQYTACGALTACFLAAVEEKGIHCPLQPLLKTINEKLRSNGFTQRSQITSSKRLGCEETLCLV